ncbi:allantoin permease [Cordyceps fumosorosea ARSEF 2679]|uniref:Allantoin permease n=1 Tax=Cordyceps fumosorosea (strain ARSEF 2679) TaxID=1081104 RepID=A0A168BVH0_CORFA|nr:allantoin permease [Cordyceps fumosorosea ARSEF 2679]OAA70596.1 allantoin permease [Cordyceps fumosorosea ARSEF 2679]
MARDVVEISADMDFEDGEPTKRIGTRDVDEALKFLGSEGDIPPMSEGDEKRLLRKIDWHIMPLITCCYFLQYLDKTLMNYANVMGIKEDTGITGNQFSLLATIFYISFIACEFPTGYLMQRLPLARYLGANIILWGIMVAANAGAHNYAALVALRVLLGCFVAVVAPALILVTGMWYKRSEQPLRVGIWYVSTGAGQIVGALASYGLQFHRGGLLASWQILFLVFGLLTVLIGVLAAWLLPSSPMTAAFLTREERLWAVQRVRANRTGIQNKHFKARQVLECLRDPQTWLICLVIILSNIPNGSVSTYQAAIIESFGFSSKESALLSVASGAVAIVSTLAVAWFGGRFNASGLGIVFLLACGGVLGGGLVAFAARDDMPSQLTGNFLTNFIGSSMALLYSYSSCNFAGNTKKVTVNAMFLVSFGIGNIVGPLTFQDRDAPRYIPAKVTIVATSCAACLLTVALMGYYFYENRRRDRLAATTEQQGNSEFYDLTDKENLEFRYRY